MLRRVASVVLLAALSATPAIAQLTEVQPGTRIRIEAAGVVAGKYEGMVLTRTADTLVLGGPNVSPIRVAVARITSLEVSHGMSRVDGAMIGMRWGIPITTAIGAMLLVTVAHDDSCTTCTPLTASEGVAVMALAALSGAVDGATIGAMIGRERWDKFDLSPRLALDVQRGRIGLGLSFGF